MALAGQKRKRGDSEHIRPTPQTKHPYLSGNFAPIHRTLPLTPCQYVGTIPTELADGEYVRNGSNPVSNDDLGRDAHWFDGDGMLSGVSFHKNEKTGHIEPQFVNQFVLTDLYLSTISSESLRSPILPSIATLVNPVASFIFVTLRILRTILLVILSHLAGSKQAIKKISVANTNVIYHDGRVLATCESGPPIRVQLPGLETVGWYDGVRAEGETTHDITEEEAKETLGHDGGLLQFMREWTTAHPKVDPETKEMLMFHSSFAPPYVQYSVVPQKELLSDKSAPPKKLVNAAVPGVHGAKMMHDFGVSRSHTVIMDLPLSLDPLNQLKGKPTVAYDSDKPSRFGVFPRHSPQAVRWFETDASCIFHTANTWDDLDVHGATETVNMLACRLTSATLVFAAGNIAPPIERRRSFVLAKRKRMPFFSKYDSVVDESYWPQYDGPDSKLDKFPLLVADSNDEEAIIEEVDDPFSEEQCRLYYYAFSLSTGELTHQWALSHLPFEFPSVRPDTDMKEARFIYGCSTTSTSFGAALGKATKIDCLVKMDAATLISNGKARPPKSVTGSVDTRTMSQVLNNQEDPNEPIKVFRMPEGWFAQEPRFVPAASNLGEDDGYLLFYAFDESQLSPAGDVPPDNDAVRRAVSELWIVKAKDMKTVVARVRLPQRVPYGLHGAWFTAEQIREQQPVESLRTPARAMECKEAGAWMMTREWIEKILG